MRKAGCDPRIGLGMEERLAPVVCYRAPEMRRGLDLEERREREGLKIIYLIHSPACLTG